MPIESGSKPFGETAVPLKKKKSLRRYLRVSFRRLMPDLLRIMTLPVGEVSKWRQQQDVMSGRESEVLKVVGSPLLPDTCDSKNLSISKCP